MSESAAPAPSPRPPRLSADDWAQAALEMVAEQGVLAVAVEPLARRLGVTKGSFYWHFPSRDALLQAALDRWEISEQQNIFGNLEGITDPLERLRRLFEVAAHEPTSLIIYSELLKALDHPAVGPVVSRVTQRRVDYLVGWFRQAGMETLAAQHRARLIYAAYVGFLQMSRHLQQPKMTHEEFDAYVDHMAQALIPG